MSLPNNPYRLVQTVHPNDPQDRAWEALEYRAALQLWAQLKEAERAGQWFAVRVRRWDQPGEYWKHDLVVDLDVIRLSDYEPPQFAPSYIDMTYRQLTTSALEEIGARTRRWVRKLLRHRG